MIKIMVQITVGNKVQDIGKTGSIILIKREIIKITKIHTGRAVKTFGLKIKINMNVRRAVNRKGKKKIIQLRGKEKSDLVRMCTHKDLN